MTACVPLPEPDEERPPGIVLPSRDVDSTLDANGEFGQLETVDLCQFPPQPPRSVPVEVGEQVCGNTDENWPHCIARECEAETFAEACRHHCEMTCERERWFCTRNHCVPPEDRSLGNTYCDTAEAMAECDALCHGDLECLIQRCETTRATRCEELPCPLGENPQCEGVACNNGCATARDGVCDDGSAINSRFSSCAPGSDCDDCGPRAACFELGAECFADSQCCGFESDLTHCVNLGSADQPLGRCLPDCSDDALLCPAHFTCQSLHEDGPDSSAACLPNCATLGGLLGTPP